MLVTKTSSIDTKICSKMTTQDFSRNNFRETGPQRSQEISFCTDIVLFLSE